MEKISNEDAAEECPNGFISFRLDGKGHRYSYTEFGNIFCFKDE